MKANDANTLAASVGCPVGANRVEWLVAEVKQLRERVAALTPRWQEGEPPCELWQVEAVWREGMSTPVRIKRFEDGLHWWFDESTCRRWDAPSPARWAPIPKPTEG